MRRVGVHGAGFIPITGMDVCPAAPVAGDWWDPNNEGLCIWAAYQPKGAANLAASYLDLSGNGNNTGPGVAPTWDAVNGWKFDGATQYLVTTFVAQTDQSQSMICQFTNVVGFDGWLGGETGGAGSRKFGIQPNFNGVPVSVRSFNGGAISAAPPILNGNYAVTDFGYRNGVVDTVQIAAWAGGAAVACYIGARNNAGVADVFCQVYIQAFAIYDCMLTGPQVAAVAAAMAAL